MDRLREGGKRLFGISDEEMEEYRRRADAITRKR